MNNSFEIIDGILYIDKTLFQESQHVENGISLLTGSFTTEIFLESLPYRQVPKVLPSIIITLTPFTLRGILRISSRNFAVNIPIRYVGTF